MSSTFDPNEFVNQSTEGAMEETFSPIPEDEYQVMILNNQDNERQQIRIREINTKNGPGYVMDVPMRVDAPGNEEAHERIVRWSGFLDFTPEHGFEFGPNKNVQLGQLRAAAGQNEPGKPWKPADLEGQILKVKVKHDPSGRFANVEEVSPA